MQRLWPHLAVATRFPLVTFFLTGAAWLCSCGRGGLEDFRRVGDLLVTPQKMFHFSPPAVGS